jgi:two-component system, NtrC family, sensor kinase
MVNAAQAIPPGAEETNEVVVRTYTRDGKVLVDITDSGEGIPTDKLREIFEPFFTSKPQGTGLGLSIARSLVDECGGAIRVESQPRHTTFTVELPAA